MPDYRKKRIIKTSAAQSVAELLKQAEFAYRAGKPSRSMRYAKMTMELVKKYKVRLTKHQKALFCRKCFTWWEVPKTLTLIFDKRHNILRLECRCGYTKRL